MYFALADGKVYATQDRFTFNVGMKVLNNKFRVHLSKHTFLMISCRNATTGATSRVAALQVAVDPAIDGEPGQPQGLRPYRLPVDLDIDGKPGQPQGLRPYRLPWTRPLMASRGNLRGCSPTGCRGPGH